MKPPPCLKAPLVAEQGGPSPAMLRAADAWPEAERGAQVAAVLKTANRSPPRFVLAATPTANAAVLAECLPGRAAVVMTPQVASDLSADKQLAQARDLLLAIDGILIKQGMLLAQALTLTRRAPATQIFLSAGYRFIGDLLYLAATLDDKHPAPIPAASSIQLVPHSPTDHTRWIRVIDQTYLQTLDCPAVDGLRPTRDVLAGYLDIGQQRDDWWFIVQHEDRDVGCLILADHHPAPHAELVYMGLIPEVRGRGWGVHLANEARRIAGQSGADQIVLSVDAANTPALRHYKSAGFQFWEQRTILVKAYSQAKPF